MLHLASASPRRRALLEAAGIEFRVVHVDVDETFPPGLNPEEVARVLARRKAGAAASLATEGLFLGADTIVVLDGEILGKPGSHAEARAMLARLSGRWHRVITGVVVVDATTGEIRQRAVTTLVRFRRLADREIEEYVLTGEPLDKAGGYGIQGAAGAFVDDLDGPYENVVGLPLAQVREMLR